jgi:2-iminobutanoate/2-iminopropanoate deaminase
MSNPTKEIVKTDRAPKPIGPYSVGIKAGQFIFTAGAAGIVPETGEVIVGGIENETRQTLLNIKNILEEAGSSLELVVKTTVFLRDMAEFSRMNAVYAEFFSTNLPARTTVQAAALPKNVAVEIDAIALVKQ